MPSFMVSILIELLVVGIAAVDYFRDSMACPNGMAGAGASGGDCGLRGDLAYQYAGGDDVVWAVFWAAATRIQAVTCETTD
jgi:hypothetical protein